MFFQPIIWLFILSLATVKSSDTTKGGIRECSGQCLMPMQLLTQEMAGKRFKIDQFTRIMEEKDATLEILQSKYNELRRKLVRLEAVVREKVIVIGKQQNLYKSCKNVNRIKDMELEAMAAQLLSKREQLAESEDRDRTKDLEEQADDNKCTEKDAEITTLQAELTKVKGFLGPALRCDSQLSELGWTVIQRRYDGSENFFRNWAEYREGFGSDRGEFFIGLERLHELTTAQSYRLYVHLKTFSGKTYYAHYSKFVVGNETELYALKSIGNYSGNAGNGLFYSVNRMFSTFDADNDRSEDHCAQEKEGAWWYDRCGHSNLNGPYFNHELQAAKSIYWLGPHRSSFKAVQMLIRPT